MEDNAHVAGVPMRHVRRCRRTTYLRWNRRSDEGRDCTEVVLVMHPNLGRSGVGGSPIKRELIP